MHQHLHMSPFSTFICLPPCLTLHLLLYTSLSTLSFATLHPPIAKHTSYFLSASSSTSCVTKPPANTIVCYSPAANQSNPPSASSSNTIVCYSTAAKQSNRPSTTGVSGCHEIHPSPPQIWQRRGLEHKTVELQRRVATAIVAISLK
ncbi:hypothetical protein SUGI_0052520 [Cryptomeria japonica]|nr:hypothetical protein SUGI_0052520 [Cryptomeria japonica]